MENTVAKKDCPYVIDEKLYYEQIGKTITLTKHGVTSSIMYCLPLKENGANSIICYVRCNCEAKEGKADDKKHQVAILKMFIDVVKEFHSHKCTQITWPTKLFETPKCLAVSLCRTLGAPQHCRGEYVFTFDQKNTLDNLFS